MGMKNRLLGIVLAAGFCSGALAKEPLREWTDEATGRVIEAELVGKSKDAKRISLRLATGRRVDVEISRLAKKDKTYATSWILAANQITARVVGSGKGWKKVKVTATASTKGGTVYAYYYDNSYLAQTRRLSPGQTITFEYQARKNYHVRFVDSDGVTKDEESWKKKTGI